MVLNSSLYMSLNLFRAMYIFTILFNISYVLLLAGYYVGLKGRPLDFFIVIDVTMAYFVFHGSQA